MKKVFIIAIIFLLLLTSCKGFGSSDNVTKLTLWHYYSGVACEKFDEYVKEFNETVGLEKNILIDAYVYSSIGELSDNLLLSAKNEIGSKQMPDIFSSYADNVFRILDYVDLVSLDEKMTENEISLYRSEFFNEVLFGENDNVKIMPVSKSTELIFINKTDFDKFASETGVSLSDLETWEDIAKTAEVYYNWTDVQTEVLNDGKPFFGVDSLANTIICMAKQNEIDIFDEKDGKVILSKEVAKMVWDFYYTPYISGFYSNFSKFCSDDLRSGNLIAYIGSTSGSGYFPKQVEVGRDNAYNIECEVLSYPTFKGKDSVCIQQGAGMAILKSDNKREDAGLEFLKWFTQPQRNAEFALTTGYIPVSNEGLDSLSTSIMESKINSDTTETVSQKASETIYQNVDELTFYSLEPFDNYYEIRAFMETYIIDLAKENAKKISEELTDYSSKKALIEEYSSDEYFDQCYNEFNYIITKF